MMIWWFGTKQVHCAMFELLSERPEIHYVILGGRIWSTELGLHNYRNATDHAGHVHVSGKH